MKLSNHHNHNYTMADNGTPIVSQELFDEDVEVTSMPVVSPGEIVDLVGDIIMSGTDESSQFVSAIEESSPSVIVSNSDVDSEQVPGPMNDGQLWSEEGILDSTGEVLDLVSGGFATAPGPRTAGVKHKKKLRKNKDALKKLRIVDETLDPVRVSNTNLLLNDSSSAPEIDSEDDEMVANACYEIESLDGEANKLGGTVAVEDSIREMVPQNALVRRILKSHYPKAVQDRTRYTIFTISTPSYPVFIKI